MTQRRSKSVIRSSAKLIQRVAGSDSLSSRAMECRRRRLSAWTNSRADSSISLAQKNYGRFRQIPRSIADTPALAAQAASYGYDDRSGAPDYRETFTMSRETIDESDPYFTSTAGRRIFTPNIWPSALPEFGVAWSAYYGEMEKLAKLMMAIFESALGLPAGWFWKKADKHISTMAAINYLEQLVDPVPGQVRLGAHTDFGAFTAFFAPRISRAVSRCWRRMAPGKPCRSFRSRTSSISAIC